MEMGIYTLVFQSTSLVGPKELMMSLSHLCISANRLNSDKEQTYYNVHVANTTFAYEGYFGTRYIDRMVPSFLAVNVSYNFFPW